MLGSYLISLIWVVVLFGSTSLIRENQICIKRGYSLNLHGSLLGWRLTVIEKGVSIHLFFIGTTLLFLDLFWLLMTRFLHGGALDSALVYSYSCPRLIQRTLLLELFLLKELLKQLLFWYHILVVIGILNDLKSLISVYYLRPIISNDIWRILLLFVLASFIPNQSHVFL